MLFSGQYLVDTYAEFLPRVKPNTDWWPPPLSLYSIHRHYPHIKHLNTHIKALDKRGRCDGGFNKLRVHQMPPSCVLGEGRVKWRKFWWVKRGKYQRLTLYCSTEALGLKLCFHKPIPKQILRKERVTNRGASLRFEKRRNLSKNRRKLF